MAKARGNARDAGKTLREAALGLPGAEEGVACAGTSLETRTVKAGGKAFLFLRPKDLRLKLGPSLVEAKRFAAEHPKSCKVGAGGWAWVALSDPLGIPLARLVEWIRESHALLAPSPRPRRT